MSEVRESHAKSTRRHYESAWRAFVAWCDEEGHEPLPATPETVAAYLTHRADGDGSVSTLKLARAAIRCQHESTGLDSPTHAAGMARVLRGLLRSAATSGVATGPGQPRGLTASHLVAIRATALLPRSGPTGRTESEKMAKRRGAVDIALASVMRDALLRRSEAAALTWADVKFTDDGSARITIRHSGTDEEGEGAFVGKEAATALKAIQDDATTDQRVFGLKSGRAVSSRIAAMARAAGLGEGFSGHSPRIGMAQDLAAHGASTSELMVAGRWKAHQMPAHYTRANRRQAGVRSPDTTGAEADSPIATLHWGEPSGRFAPGAVPRLAVRDTCWEEERSSFPTAPKASHRRESTPASERKSARNLCGRVSPRIEPRSGAW